jgi:hypothetical protein
MSTVSRAFTDTMPMYGSIRSSGKAAAFAMFTCRCETPTLYRVQRAFWMRFVPAMRLYVCRNCGTRVLRRRMRELCSAAYRQAFPDLQEQP